ncbi:MAG: 4-(cytidine 5'-diphospho)-2-C-methyl-D-erythritol kinase [Muribaculaceae bacterium]|nr:4-(cytidine 5'-diphospho)-2-C-methyl-D-erythritol kinase [Muribaculaceae bacterium]
MIQFVNAKLNLGLNIVRKREDGYHLLETIFYPVGLYNGTPENPDPFCDILEVIPAGDNVGENRYFWSGRKIDCPLEKNLVYRAAELITEETGRYFDLYLEKYLPDGAGLGGGSADASFTLKALNEISGRTIPDARLKEMALSLGADCPFFIDNIPAYGEGIGEILTPVEQRLKGMWCVIVKPDVYVSTREAFAGITPHPSATSLRDVYSRPVSVWREFMHNDFEESIFPQHPELAVIKQQLYGHGAIYAQMSGSGSSIFGLFDDVRMAKKCREAFVDLPTYLSLL